MNDSQRVSILSEALPYIQSFSGRKIVIKYGGSVMENDNLKNAFFRDIALLSTVGVCFSSKVLNQNLLSTIIKKNLILFSFIEYRDIFVKT